MLVGYLIKILYFSSELRGGMHGALHNSVWRGWQARVAIDPHGYTATLHRRRPTSLSVS